MKTKGEKIEQDSSRRLFFDENPIITKKPKRVKVYHEKIIIYNDKYQCPSCNAFFNNFGIIENIKRFNCQCGQELIAEHVFEK